MLNTKSHVSPQIKLNCLCNTKYVFEKETAHLPVSVGEKARHKTSESWASIFCSSSINCKPKILKKWQLIQLMFIYDLVLCVDPSFSHLRFPLRSPAAKRWPSGLIPSTLIPDLPSWHAPSAFSASALRYCVSSSTYTILTMSWNTTINEYEKNVLANYSIRLPTLTPFQSL